MPETLRWWYECSAGSPWGSAKYKGRHLGHERELAALFGWPRVLEVKLPLQESDQQVWLGCSQYIEVLLADGTWTYKPNVQKNVSCEAVNALRTCTYNCQSLVQQGRLRYILRIAAEKQIDVLALQGTRLGGGGCVCQFTLLDYHIVSFQTTGDVPAEGCMFCLHTAVFSAQNIVAVRPARPAGGGAVHYPWRSRCAKRDFDMGVKVCCASGT
eukprot:1553886-Amphidinium_carterae.1